MRGLSLPSAGVDWDDWFQGFAGMKTQLQEDFPCVVGGCLV